MACVGACAGRWGFALEAHLVKLVQGKQTVPAIWGEFLAVWRHTWLALGPGLRGLGLPPAFQDRIGEGDGKLGIDSLSFPRR